MSMNEIESKIKELRQLQSLIEEAQQEAEAIKDAIKAHMGDSEELRAGEYRVTWNNPLNSYPTSNTSELSCNLLSGWRFGGGLVVVPFSHPLISLHFSANSLLTFSLQTFYF